jgi:hypothetical protein
MQEASQNLILTGFLHAAARGIAISSCQGIPVSHAMENLLIKWLARPAPLYQYFPKQWMCHAVTRQVS